MATIIVDTTLDENDGSIVDGDVSLRDALAAANFGDTVIFASGAGEAFETGGTIRLSKALGELIITKDLTIDGDIDDDGAPDVTITGDTLGDDATTTDSLGNTITDAGNNANTVDNVRVFNVTGGASALDGVVITGGFSSFEDNKGGGVLVTNDSVLMVRNSSVSGNSGPDGEGGAAGIHNAGTLILTDTTVSGNKHSSYMGSRGGGLFNEGTAILSNSTVSDNGAGVGSGILNVGTATLIDMIVSGNGRNFNTYGAGGIANGGILMLTDTTVSDNSSEYGAGGISNGGTATLIDTTVSGNRSVDGNGGGINNSGDLTLTNTTVSGNRSGVSRDGGGIFNTGTVTLTNTTVSGNTASDIELIGGLGGGIFNSGTAALTLANSIVLGNRAFEETPGYGGTQIDSNIEGTFTETAPNLIGGAAGDVFAAIDGATGGGRLADNGGAVETIALKNDAANPALDAGQDDRLDESVAGIDLNGDGDTADVIDTDARGTDFNRFVNLAGLPNSSANMVDLGAFELLANPATGVISGTGNADTITPGLVSVGVTGGQPSDGDDTIEAYGGSDTVDGGGGADSMDGGSGNDSLLGRGGDDTLKGSFGFDTLDGGEGTDTADLSHTGVAATIDLAAGQAVFSGGVETLIGIENAIGTDGDNFMTGTDGANKLEGRAGDDTLRGGLGYDTLDGGEGTDTADLSHTGAPATIDLATGQAVFGGGVETLICIENAIGTDGDNFMTGTAGANKLEGGGGDDTLRGGFGYDTMDGGEGTDTADLSHSGSAADIDLAAGQAVFAGGVETLISIENAIGTDGNNFMTGTAGANKLEGRGGDDTLRGGLGYDTLDGGEGTDTADLSHSGSAATIDLSTGQAVFGGGVETLTGIENAIGTNGNNAINGTGGANTLEGGGGNDTLEGAGGPDRFLFRGTAFDQDTIVDFAPGADKIVFDGVGGVNDADDPTYTVGNFDGAGQQDIRITFAGLGGDLLGERIDVLDVGTDIGALKAEMLFV